MIKNYFLFLVFLPMIAIGQKNKYFGINVGLTGTSAGSYVENSRYIVNFFPVFSPNLGINYNFELNDKLKIHSAIHIFQNGTGYRAENVINPETQYLKFYSLKLNSLINFRIYKKFRGLSGFSFSNQISNASVTEEYYSYMLGFYDLSNDQVINLKKYELGWILGLGYDINKRFSLNYNFYRSFIDNFLVGGFQKKFLSHNLTVQFNFIKSKK